MRDLERKISYQFKSDSMIDRAFTHSSYINESENKSEKSYERLEFLGDAVLQLAVSELLYQQFPRLQEGVLSKMRSKIVCEDSLYEVAQKLDLGRYIKFSKGEEKSGGRNRKSILADVVESMIAVVYLEGSFEQAKALIERLLGETVRAVAEVDSVDDYKSLLQIWAQANKRDLPTYKVIESSGPEHNKVFKSAVLIGGKEIAFGVGKSKRASEKEAAKLAYFILNKGTSR
ncbi:MAG: ribonuclease III [Bacillota bacterium]|nr:ribonuclease III [Bacillota bacterium]